jgi:hypothetical protein
MRFLSMLIILIIKLNRKKAGTQFDLQLAELLIHIVEKSVVNGQEA